MGSFFLYSSIIAVITAVVPEKLYIETRKARKQVNIYVVLVLGLMCFMISFRRYDIGNDTLAYQRFFTHMRAGDYLYDARVEVLFRYLAIAVSRYSENYTHFLIVTSVTIFTALGKYIVRYTDNAKLYVMIFWFFAFVSFVSPLRQSLALVFVFWSLQYVKDKRYILFLIAVVLGTLCHTTAIVALLFPFIYRVKPKSFKVFLSLLVVIVLVGTGTISVFANALLGDYYSRYLSVESGILAAAFNSIFGIIPILIDRYKESVDDDLPHYYNLMRWSSAVYSGFYIASVYSSGAGRIAYYFLPMTISYWCYVIDRKGWNVNTRMIIVTVLFIVLIAYRLLIIIYRPEWNSFFPFHYIWDV